MNQPTELEMHRADYQACKAAGFESPGELLSAYRTLEDRLSVANNRALLISRNLAFERELHQKEIADASKRIDYLLSQCWISNFEGSIHGVEELDAAIAAYEASCK